MKIRDHLPSKTFAKIKFTMVFLIKGFWILEQSSPKSCELVKTYHEDIFFQPKKFSLVDPSTNEPLKQYIDPGLNILRSRVLAATVFLKPGSTLTFEKVPRVEHALRDG